MSRNLADHAAIVTGASGGIGRAIVHALANAGATLGVLGRRQHALETVARECARDGLTIAAYCCDLVDEQQIRATADRMTRNHARIDILVHCAGAIAFGPIASAPIADLDLQYRVNLRAPYLLTQLLLPRLIAAHGQVVFVNSSVGIRTKEHVSAYAATKHALKAVADTLRMEVNAHDVRVLTVYPGNTATTMQQVLGEHSGTPIASEYLLRPDDIASVVLNCLLLPRAAEITDVSIRPMRKSPIKS